MFRKGRYAHLKGSSAYYPFGARTSLRKRQRRRVILLRVLGLLLFVPVAILVLRQTVFRGGQPERPSLPAVQAEPYATGETAASGPVPVTVRVPANEDAAQPTPEPTPAPTELLPQYKQLFIENDDMVGWLNMDAVGIDYPVMQTPGDNEYYIRRGFDGLYSMAGSLFLDENCRLYDPATANWIIYGHNMTDGSMFAGLLYYADPEFYKEHSTFRFDTLFEEMEWQIVMVLQTQVGQDELPYYSFFDAANEAQWQKHYDAMKQRALYDTGVDAVYGDQLLTLSTCGEANSYTTSRFAVVAKRIR